MSNTILEEAERVARELEDQVFEKAVNMELTRELCRYGSSEFPELTESLESINFPDPTERYVAGETTEEVYEYVEELNDSGVTAIVNNLGEHLNELGEVENVKEEYEELLEEFETKDLDAEISVKLTQLGWELDEGPDKAREHVTSLVKKAEESGRKFWIDMEHSEMKDGTIEFYEELTQEYDNVGLCLQSYIQDTVGNDDEQGDLERLQEIDGSIRLVKGAYDSERDFDDTETSKKYKELMDKLFQGDAYFAIATHDEDLVERALELQEEYDKDPDEFEFQFLKGVADDIQADLAENYTVKEYVPYGDNRFEYFWRRVQEYPKNLKHGLGTIAQEAEINPGKVPGDIARMV